MDKNVIKELMMKAIEEPRPKEVVPYCSPIWNQPFFYQIDKAKALTISYAPTDRGARLNYPYKYRRFIEDNNYMTTEEIYDLLYSFEKESKWRNIFDKIFTSIGIWNYEIAHMDMSSFAYTKDIYRKQFMDNGVDRSYRYPLQAVDLLSDQLQYILIDGKDNRKILDRYFIKDYDLINSTSLVVNRSGKKADLLVYRHKSKKIKLIYFGTFLYGLACVSKECVEGIIDFIKSCR